MSVRKLPIALLAATIGTATQSAFCQYSPSFDWQTGEVRLVCLNSFAFKEARAALQASDPTWLRQIGCLIEAQGLKIALIDAPVASATSIDIWYGRIYPADGRAPYNAYFYALTPVTYALYGPFRDRADAERETKPLIERLHQAAKEPRWRVSYEIIGSPGAVKARIGPAIWRAMNVFCLWVQSRNLEEHRSLPGCQVTGKRP
jgi:hypothetical protein